MSELEPGRELDHAVASKIMGWEYKRWAVDRRHMMWHSPEGHADNVPRFSTEIAAAWEVVENVVARGYDADFGLRRDFTVPQWEATFASPDKVFYWAIAPTVQLAICQAALKTVSSGHEAAANAEVK